MADQSQQQVDFNNQIFGLANNGINGYFGYKSAKEIAAASKNAAPSLAVIALLGFIAVAGILYVALKK